MSRILLVEPRHILRQAMSVALFAEHDLQLAASVSAINESAAQEFDLIIIDSAALRQAGKASDALLQELQVPMIWIDDTNAGQALPQGKTVVLKSPIEKDALQSAIARCLDGSPANRNPTAARLAKGRTTTKETRTAADARASKPQIIELVDVVAEPPERVKA